MEPLDVGHKSEADQTQKKPRSLSKRVEQAFDDRDRVETSTKGAQKTSPLTEKGQAKELKKLQKAGKNSEEIKTLSKTLNEFINSDEKLRVKKGYDFVEAYKEAALKYPETCQSKVTKICRNDHEAIVLAILSFLRVETGLLKTKSPQNTKGVADFMIIFIKAGHKSPGFKEAVYEFQNNEIHRVNLNDREKLNILIKYVYT